MSDKVWCCPASGCRRRLVVDHLYTHLTGDHSVEDKQAMQMALAAARDAAIADLEFSHPRMREWTLDTFPAADLAGRRALSAVREWLDAETCRLLLYGSVGAGKTGLAFGLARAWIERSLGPVHFVNVRRLLEEQRARFSCGEPKAIDHLLDASDDELVVLDDLGAERPTEFAVETVSLIVERLHVNDIALVVTSNYDPAGLAKRLGGREVVEGKRIVSRLVEDALVIELARGDLRARRVA
jgi:DNA replication protein DnaC